MRVHTIIESLSAYEAVRAEDPTGKRIWWTTSPFLLVRLAEFGEEVRSPEDGLENSEFDALAKASKDFAKRWCYLTDAQAKWAEHLNLVRVLEGHVRRCFFVTFYKGLLLDLVLSKAEGDPVVCVGDPDDPGLTRLTLIYGRLETLYARLATIWATSDVLVFRHVVSKEKSATIDKSVTHRKLEKKEKLLSLLNNTPSSFLYKAWRNLAVSRLWPFRGISLWLRPRKTIYVAKDCELIEEAFLAILWQGGRIRRLPNLPQPDMARALTELPESDSLRANCRELSRKALQDHGLAFRNSYQPCMEMLGTRLLVCCEALWRNLPEFERVFSQITSSMHPGDEILTSSINGIIERLFAEHCRRHGVRVNTVEHGVTIGFSEWSGFHADISGMAIGERAFYHCRHAADVIGPNVPEQIAHIVGLPRITATPPFRALQRFLSRKILGIKRNENVIMIVCDLPHNNFIYGPQLDNDLQFLRKTKQFATETCAVFTKSVIVLKLYPTQRYLDDYDFSDLLGKFKNLRIIKEVEFRFIRTAADLIFTSSSQSTLGWVSGSGVPFIFLEFAWSPSNISGLRLMLPGIDGLSAAILPDAGQVCTPPEEGVASVLLREEVS